MAYTNTRAKQSQDGEIGKLADEEMERFRIAVPGSDDDHVAYPDATTERPLGITVDGCEAAEEAVALALLGRGDTKVVKLNGSCTKDDPICPEDPNTDATGKAREIPTTPGAYWLIGFALEDGADEQEIGLDDCRPTLVGAWDPDNRQFAVPAFEGDPTTPLESGLWYDITNDKYRVRNGTALATIQVVED